MKRPLTLTLITLAAAATAFAADNLKAYPPAEDGMIRYVLNLPEAEDEALLKVELIVGKTVTTDAVNRYFFGGQITESNVEGWGFPRYDVARLGPMAGTLMAPDPDAPQVERFITLGGEPYLIRYNSKLPVVIYIPEDAEVRYRIWRAPAETEPMERG